ncbi:serine/threonine-protein kinase [Leptolyngbya ohadii]|uniref:serine/threonine-protein kinase n=1 Tax=Leptolyngbya ohadii TaxID=1962290 RepID=UPI000B59E525|nr:serine/threonine-protein kinase [Leptolyngbya ohadii]
MNKPRSPIPTPSIRASRSSQRSGTTATGQRGSRRTDWGRGLVGVWALAAATATALNLGVVQFLERQVQTLFFEMRGAVTPPREIVILAIDESSLTQGEFFRSDPGRYADLAPIQSWPWERSAYAAVVDKLMAAGADAVAIDVIFSSPSSYGEQDDRQFAQVLQKYAGRVTLASQYGEVETLQGYTTQLTSPLLDFCDRPDCTGFINFPIEPNYRIHRLGESFLQQFLQNAPPAEAEVLPQTPSFAKSTLQAAQRSYPTPAGESIFFYGPANSFTQIPFWTVLDPEAWQVSLQSDTFKNKIVLIGSTAAVHQDFHAAPFSKSWLYPQPMSGVEVHANAIATLLEGRSIAEAVPQAPLRGLWVLVGVVGAGWWFTRQKQPLRRFIWAIGFAAGWLGVGYVLFVQARLIIPTAVPAGAIALSGLGQLIVGSAKEQVKKRQLRDTLKQYVTSPIVQEIISQHDDLQDLLRERELALAGKVLVSRYRITRVLGSGGFSETYIAEDLQRPGNPQCVVKQLRVASNNPKTLREAKRLFAIEAETLERLGRHDQIPRLLASFEEDQEFYLVQDYIQGQPLTREILPQRILPESRVVQMIAELLNVLAFVHSQGVIHRDLKPSNIIRRRSDDRLVLIDFGIAKKITTQLAEGSGNTKFTIAVGTPGYMPSEQSAGRPQFNSDIYALGMMAIEALTGQSAHILNHDARTGAIRWVQQARSVNPALAAILNKMVHHDFTQRYRSVQEVQRDLMALYPDLAIADGAIADESDKSAERPDAPLPRGLALETQNPDDDRTISLPEDWLNQEEMDGGFLDKTLPLPQHGLEE